MQIPWLEPGDSFPPTDTALSEPNGLLAAGGDLSVATLLKAYRAGIFPWFSHDEPILWWSPAPRTLLWPRRLHISRSLAKLLRQQRFEIRINSCFSEVISACAETPRGGQDGSWINAEMQQAYLRLHRSGHAHSFETFMDGELAGGLYGVKIGAMFFGESMFSWRDNASKLALASLCAQTDIRLIDCQMPTAHLLSLGAQQLSRQRFERALAYACRQLC